MDDYYFIPLFAIAFVNTALVAVLVTLTLLKHFKRRES
jgi:hypothetical protein